MKVMQDGVIAIPREMIDRYGLALRVEVDMEPRDGGILIRKSKRKPGNPMDFPYTIPRGGVIQDLRGDDPFIWGRRERAEEEVDANRMLVYGQVAVPVELLELYGLDWGDELECKSTEDGILVWKSENQPDNPLGPIHRNPAPAAASSTSWAASTVSSARFAAAGLAASDDYRRRYQRTVGHFLSKRRLHRPIEGLA